MLPPASEMRRRGRAALTGNWPLAILVLLVGALLGGLSWGAPNITIDLDIPFYPQPGDFLYEWIRGLDNPACLFTAYGVARVAALWWWLTFFIGSAVELGCCLFFANMHRGRAFGFATLTERFPIFLKALGLRLYIFLFTLLWSLLLIVPGIIAAYRYSMAPYLMAENPELGVAEAVEMSKYMMDGSKGRLFCLDISFIGWLILSSLTLGIGDLFLNPYRVSARTAFYLDLLERRSPYRRDYAYGPDPNAANV